MCIRDSPYLFSNSLAPGIIGASLEVVKILKESNALHDKLVELSLIHIYEMNLLCCLMKQMIEVCH